MNLTELRESKGFTNKTRFAELVKISKSYLDQLELGNYNPTLAVVQRLADVMDVPINIIAQCIQEKTAVRTNSGLQT